MLKFLLLLLSYFFIVYMRSKSYHIHSARIQRVLHAFFCTPIFDLFFCYSFIVCLKTFVSHYCLLRNFRICMWKIQLKSQYKKSKMKKKDQRVTWTCLTTFSSRNVFTYMMKNNINLKWKKKKQTWGKI